MRRALVLGALLVSAAAHAEEAAVPEDAKAAIAARGIVLEAGKRHFIVIVPPEDKPDATLAEATIYFGDAKTLFKQSVKPSAVPEAGRQKAALDDSRMLFQAILARTGNSYDLTCHSSTKKREIALTVASDVASRFKKTAIKPLQIAYTAHVFARVPNTTTYVYVDSTSDAPRSYRLFHGKRGAMKKLALKEVADDERGLVLVTTKGTFAFRPEQRDSRTGATTTPASTVFGSEQSPATLDVLDLSFQRNREVIYQGLGVYTRDRSGYPCDEL